MEKLIYENYNENYIRSLMIHSFSYFDNTISKEKFEEETENLFQQFEEIKQIQSKCNMRNFIEFIEKFYNKENNIILENLELFSTFLFYFIIQKIRK
jgi:hypothetical protein